MVSPPTMQVGHAASDGQRRRADASHALSYGEGLKMELAAGQMDHAAADGRKKQGRRAPCALARGWRLPLATEVDQSAAGGKKKWAAAPQASLRGKS